jgi:LemA protein
VKRLAFAVALLLLLSVAVARLAACRKNLGAQREEINAAWTRLELALQRRAGLVPRLLETVNPVAKREQAVVDSLTGARGALAAARTPLECIAANSRLDSAIARLLVVLANYPGLQSRGDFLRLQDELFDAESRLAGERRRYNEAVQRYNMSLGLFPYNIAAALFGFAPHDAPFKTGPASLVASDVAF